MPTTRHAHSRSRLLAMVGLTGVGLFIAAVLALHATSIGHEPWHMSEFAHSPFWLLWACAVVLFAVGGTAVTFALKPSLAESPWKKAGLCMLWLAGVGTLVMAACPVDRDAAKPTLPGTIHEEIAPPTFVLSGAAMVVLVPAFRGDGSWRRLARPSMLFGVFVTISALTYVACTEMKWAFAAIAQRVLVSLIAAWFILVALRILKVHDDAEPALRRAAPRPGRRPTPQEQAVVSADPMPTVVLAMPRIRATSKKKGASEQRPRPTSD